MAKRLSNDSRVWVKLSDGSYAQVSGNQALSRSLTTQPMDTSTKSDFPWGTNGAGSRAFSINAGFLPDLPDPGFQRIADVATDLDAQETLEIQIRTGGDGGADPDDVIFEGQVWATDASDNMDMNTPWTHSFVFSPAAKPTVYLL